MVRYINLVKKFGPRTVLKKINLEIGQGEIVFILGTSGTGKSVLLKNTVGLLRPDEGEIWLDGEEISKLEESDFFRIRQKCGMVFQQPALFDSLSIEENLSFALKRRSQLSSMEIRDKIRSLLNKIQISESVLGKKPVEVSYGMQKRISLARTVITEPKVLLFDEPTTGLDPINTTVINQLIHKLSKEFKTTSIVVSHDMKCAMQIADRIVVLDQGEVLAQGSVAEMKNSTVPLVQSFLQEVNL